MRLALAFALSVSTLPAWADDRAEHCQQWYDIAFKIMGDRQAGAPMPEVIAYVGQLPEQHQETARKMAVRVFGKTRHIAPIQQEMETAEFANAAFGACYGG